MNEALELIERFHGHLGPYAVVGYRMGLVANKRLGDDPFKKRCVSLTGTTPPISCIIDGIQLASGCTFGKGNLTAEFKALPQARFSDETGKNSFEIELRPEIKDGIDRDVTKENIEAYSAGIFQKPDEEIFIIRE